MNANPEAVPAEIASLSYEEAVQMLEQTVARLETGETSLDESMALFRRGMVLSQHCASLLAAIEKQITQLVEKANGQLEEKPFSEET